MGSLVSISNKVSIIVPVYNLVDYISSCLDSLINQTYFQLEIVVIDDGSTDDSWGIITNYAQKDDRIIALRQENGGAGKTRNFGLQQMTGDFFVFVDGDDQLSKDTIELNLKYLICDETLDWVAFPVYRINEKNKETHSRNIFEFIPKEAKVICKEQLMPFFFESQLSGIACGAIYRKSKIGRLRFPENEFYEDSFYFTELLLQTNKAFISTMGKYCYLDREGSAQLTKVDAPRLLSKMNLVLIRINEFRNINPELFQTYRKMESDFYYYLRTAKEKKIQGAQSILNQFQSQMQYTIKRNLRKELKLFFYRYIGYERLRKLGHK